MRLSLSVRIAEGFLSKEEATLTLEEVCQLAKESGYDALCLRASQIGIHSSQEAIAQAANTLAAHNMPVNMLTGDFATVYNNDQGPDSLRNISPYLDLAESLRCSRLRVALKHVDDIPHARRAADEASQRGITLLHQCHIQSLFETVDGIVNTLQSIDRPNFRLIYEPANLEQCGQDYGLETLRRLAPYIDNVYLQNQRLHEAGVITLDTWCRGPAVFDLLQIHEPGGIDFNEVVASLHAVGYAGIITVHQSAPPSGDTLSSARATAAYLQDLLS